MVNNLEYPENLLLQLPFLQIFVEQAAVKETFNVFFSNCRLLLNFFSNFEELILTLPCLGIFFLILMSVVTFKLVSVCISKRLSDYSCRLIPNVRIQNQLTFQR